MNIRDAEFEFNTMNFIFGKPASGKSAIFEAISVCLSDTKRAGTYGEYVRQGCDFSKIYLDCDIDGKNALFDVTLNRVQGTPYECVLKYNNNEYKNTEVDSALKEKNLDYYLKIMFQMQHDKDIIEQTPASRLIYVQKLFNFDFSSQKQQLTEMMTKNKESTLEVNAKLSTYETMKKALSTHEELLEHKYTPEELGSFQEKIKINNEKINNAQKILLEKSSLEKELSKIFIEISKVDSDIKIKSMRLDDLKKEQNGKDSLKVKLEEMRETLTENESKKEEFESSKKELSEKNVEFANLIESLTSSKNEVTYKRSSLKEKVDLINAGICPTCGQKTGHIDDSAISELEQCNSLIESYTARIAQAVDSKNKNSEKLNDIITHLQYVNDTISSTKMSLSFYEKQISVDNSEEIIKVEKELEDLKTSKENLNKEYFTLDEKIKSIKCEDVPSLVNENSELSNIISSEDNIYATNKNIVERNNEKDMKLKELENSKKELEDALVNNNNAAIAYDEAFNVLNKLLPQYMSKAFCDVLQAKINSFVNVIFPTYFVKMSAEKKGCELKYTKDKSVVDEKRNSYIDVKMSSGFERAVLNLAFKTSLAELYNIDLFIGDEIDKAANDEDSIKLINLLLAYQNYNQIFLISHKKALFEYLADTFDDYNLYEANSGKFTKKD